MLGPLGKTGTFQPGENFPGRGAANHNTYDALTDTLSILGILKDNIVKALHLRKFLAV